MYNILIQFTKYFVFNKNIRKYQKTEHKVNIFHLTRISKNIVNCKK